MSPTPPGMEIKLREDLLVAFEELKSFVWTTKMHFTSLLRIGLRKHHLPDSYNLTRRHQLNLTF